MGLPNVGSLVLGLIAWVLPIVNLERRKRNNHKNGLVLLYMSYSACAISLCFQIFYQYHLVQIEDWGAIADTMGGVALAAGILLLVTIVLNAIFLFVDRDRTAV
jgi:hypothetical protein